MAEVWKKELKDIINSGSKDIEKVIAARDARENERLKEINDIKKVIRPRMEFIKDIFEKGNYFASTTDNALGGSGETEKVPTTPTDRVDVVKDDHAGAGLDICEDGSAFIEACRRGKRVSVPTVNEGPTELVLIMPVLSDVNRLDLLFRVEFKEDKPVLHAYDLLSSGKLQDNGSAHDDFECFIQDTLKRFLLSWFTRKRGTELDKERKFQLHITGRGLKI